MAKVCLRCTAGSGPVSRGQEREPAPLSPRGNVPCCPAAWPTAAEHLPYVPPVSFPQHGHPAAPSAVMTSKSPHKGHWLGMAAVPCQPRARHNDSRDKRVNISTPGSLPLSPLSRGCVDKTNDPRPSESAQMHYAKKQLEAQRAKFAAKDTNDSDWLL